MVVLFALLLLGVRIDNNDYVKILKYKTWDYFQIIHPRNKLSDSVTVVNITESDLKKYGQWPWPRHIIAMVHAKIVDAGAVMINHNILYAEPDRMSGVEYLKSMPMDNELRDMLGEALLDTDGLFAVALNESNSVLMMSVKNDVDNILPSTTQIIKKGNVNRWIYEFGGIVSPTPKLSATAKGIGVNVTSPEPDAVVRKMPMIVSINGKLYPSMILENLRLLYGSKRIKVVAKEHGIDEVLIKKDVGIPVNHNAEMYISYTNPKNIVQMSVDEIVSGDFNENKLKNRIVVIGLDAAGLSVLKYTPFGLTTDQLITAQALDTLLTGEFLYRPAEADTYEVFFMAALALLLILLIPRTSVLLSVPLLLFVTGGITYASFMAYANKGWLVDPSFAVLFIFLIWAHSTYNNFATQSRLRKQIKKQFEHYLDPGMVKKLQKDPSLLKLGGETKEMTFLFSDIRGFTPISEKYKGNPEGLTKLINRFLTRMTDVIIANGGTIDKFMGDCIMAFWNAPIENKKHRILAIKSAIQMQDALEELNKHLVAEGLPKINIGIGINTGEHSIETFYPFEYIDSITVKGKTEPVKVYSVKN